MHGCVEYHIVDFSWHKLAPGTHTRSCRCVCARRLPQRVVDTPQCYTVPGRSCKLTFPRKQLCTKRIETSTWNLYAEPNFGYAVLGWIKVTSAALNSMRVLLWSDVTGYWTNEFPVSVVHRGTYLAEFLWSLEPRSGPRSGPAGLAD